MNRIELYYYPKKDDWQLDRLIVRNDIKGYSNEVIAEFEGSEAKIMFDLLSNVDYSKLENYINYGITVYDRKDVK